jgi:GDP-mannose pyrophosphatase NudK
MSKVRIKNTKKLSDEHYTLKRIEFSIQKKTGEWEDQQREVYDHGNAVAALLYNKEQGTVILTRQFRIATFVNGNETGMLTEACAGLLEEGESPDETVKREITEETGYEVSEVRKVYDVYSSAGSLTELLYLYIAPYTKDQKVSKGGGLEEEGEEVEVIEMPFDEAWNLMQENKLNDAKTVMLLQYVKLMELI